MNSKHIRVLVILLLLLFTAVGCVSKRNEEFAIYLLADDIPPSETPILSYVTLAEQPIISTSDIVSYSKLTHEMELTTEAYERILKLEVPTNGKAFVVTVHRHPVYHGAFWTPLSSMSFDGIAILKPLSLDQHRIQLQLGYPSRIDFTGEDPRTNLIIVQSLERTGKL